MRIERRRFRDEMRPEQDEMSPEKRAEIELKIFLSQDKKGGYKSKSKPRKPSGRFWKKSNWERYAANMKKFFRSLGQPQHIPIVDQVTSRKKSKGELF